jgi:hypothetical protein
VGLFLLSFALLVYLALLALTWWGRQRLRSLNSVGFAGEVGFLLDLCALVAFLSHSLANLRSILLTSAHQTKLDFLRGVCGSIAEPLQIVTKKDESNSELLRRKIEYDEPM